MTQQEILERLSQMLVSPTWNELKTSFIGRELLQYASSVIYLSQQQVDSIRNNQYVDTADLSSLLLYCFNRDIPVNIDRPAYVKAVLSTDQLLLPYSVTLSSGGNLFTNIDYINGQEEAMFYQGIVTAMYTKNLANIQENVTEPFITYYDSEEGSYFLKLGKSALFESVRAYVEKDSVLLISEYDVLRENPDSNVMKLKRGFDGSLNLYFGNGVWGARYNSQYNYHIVWLNSTQSNFDADSLILTSNVGSFDFKIYSTDAGLADDITLTRQNAREEITKLSVAATESQIKSLVNASPSVIDCLVSPSTEESNKVTVYVKPRVITDTIFDSVQDKLNLYGEIVTQYQVLRGEPIYFYVYLRSYITLSQGTKNDIEQVIKNYLQYQTLPYKVNASSITINDQIYYLSDGNVYASIRLKQSVTVASDEILLPTKPYRGTIQILQNGNLVGWDTEGILYAAVEPVTVNLDNFFKIGDFFISCTSSVISYNIDFTRAADSTGYTPFEKVIRVLFDSGRALLQKANKVVEIDINDTFVNGEYSIQRNPTSRIAAVTEINTNLDLTYAIYQKGVGVYRIVNTSDQYFLYKYEFRNGLLQTPNFSVIVAPKQGWVIKALAKYNQSCFVFFDKGVRYIQDYSNPTASEDIYVDTIEFIKNNLNNIIIVNMDNIFTIMIKTEKEGKLRYQLVRSSGFEVIGTVSKRMVLRTEFQTQFDVEYETEHDFQILSQSISEIYLLDKTDKILYRIVNGIVTTVATEETFVNMIVKIGNASYSSNVLTLDGRTLQGLEFLYETSEPLNSFSDDKFPVLDSIIWE